MKREKLPTLHEIVEQQKQVMSQGAFISVATSSEPVGTTGDEEPQPTQQPNNVDVQPDKEATPFYMVFDLSTNSVLKAAWEKALLQYFKSKINDV